MNSLSCERILLRASSLFLLFHLLQSSAAPLSVLHLQYPDWPDHGVPVNTGAVRDILKRLYHLPVALGPLVVHCRSSFVL